MITLANLETTVPATPAELYGHWADVDTHPVWSTDLSWTHLDEPLRLGARGRLKPKGGPRSRFTVTELVPGRTFADTTHLLGARLTFRHHADPTPDGARVQVRVTLEGPLARVWACILGAAATSSGVESDLANLVALIGAGTPPATATPATATSPETTR